MTRSEAGGGRRSPPTGLRWSLGRKISVIVLVILVAGFGVMIAFQVVGESRRILKTYDEGQYNVTRQLANSMTAEVRFGRAAAIDTTFDALVHEKGSFLTDIEVFDTGGALLTSYHRSNDGLGPLGWFDPMPFLASGRDVERRIIDDHALFAVPVRQGSAVLGVLVAGWTRAPIIERTRSTLLIQVGLAVVAALVLIGVLLWALDAMVVTPVRATTRSLSRLAEGDYAAPVPMVSGTTEMGAMADAFEVFRATAIEKERLHQDLARAHDEAKRNENRTKLVLSTAPFPILVRARSDRRILFINAAGLDFFQARADDAGDLTRLKNADYYLDEADRDRMIAVLADGGEVRDREVRIRRPGGSRAWCLVTAVPMALDGEPASLVTFADITRLKQAERELERAKDVAEQAALAKTRFLATMSHEIRTPMNAILGLTHLAQRTELTPKQRDYLSKINRSAQSLLGIINDILDFSKIEAGKMQLEHSEFSLDAVLDNLANLVVIKAEEKGLELLFSVSSHTPGRLFGDPLRLGQVLVNLANNAVKFTERGEILISVEPAAVDDRSTLLLFSVKDSGIGMTADQIERLFQPFSQADSSVTRKFGGTGLGLSICRQLVDMMGGRIWVDSRPGEGSTFRFTVRLGVAGRKRAAPRPAHLAGHHVLVVDDNRTARRILSEMLVDNGFTVSSATGGLEALEALRRASAAGKPFDLVLMDWRMPDMDGIEASRRIRQDENLSATPAILMITAFGREEVVAEAVGAGLDGFLVKPVSEGVLLNTIRAIFSDGEDPATPLPPPADRKIDTGGLAGARVLLVEDNAINRQVAVELLAEAGIEVDTAEDGLKGIEKARAGRYDLILMDIQMPEMDGLTATRRLRREPAFADLPIIAMTAHAMTGDAEKSLDAGMSDHLPKPIDPDALFAVLRRWLPAATGGAAPARAPAPRGEAEDHGLPARTGFDFDDAYRRIGRDPGLLRRLLTSFHANYGTLAERVALARSAGRDDDLQRFGHTLKSAAAYVGAGDVAAAAAHLERTAGRGHDRETGEACEAFRAALDQAMATIEGLEIAPGPAAGDSAGRPAPVGISELLTELAPLVAEGNIEAERLIDDLAGRLAESEWQDRVAALRAAFDDLDLDRAAALVDDLKGAAGSGTKRGSP